LYDLQSILVKITCYCSIIKNNRSVSEQLISNET